MPQKEIIAPEALGRTNPSLSPATRFGDLVFVSGQTGRNPATGEVGADIQRADAQRAGAHQDLLGGSREPQWTTCSRRRAG